MPVTAIFKTLSCIEGKVYCPKALKENKYPCSDCFACQKCSQDRCEVCREDIMAKKEKPMLKKRKKEDIKSLPEYQNIELYQYKAKVIRVVDADTVDAAVDVGFGLTMNQRFRINNYDAPETWIPRNEAERKHGKEATARAIELLIGKDILLKSTKAAGIYGRFGADIWLEDGNNFIEVMINEGFSKRDNY